MVIGQFVTLVAPIKAFVDLLTKLLGAEPKRRKARFDELVRPLHDSFQEVHADYSTLLRQFERRLPLKAGDEEWLVFDRDVPVYEPEAIEITRSVTQEFAKKREDLEGIRDYLRGSAHVVLAEATDAEERRYLYSLLVYFLPDDHRPHQDDEALDREIRAILEMGGESAMNTPTSRLLREIRGVTDPEEVRSAVQRSIDRLNQRCSDVLRTYVALVKAVTVEQAT
ncbi:MAG TPA: hypothetical protein VF173_06235 [Thermoanaerobaculia bacterium]|nr:hypothetical protein [Thermoanaerobaculia bacterium]